MERKQFTFDKPHPRIKTNSLEYACACAMLTLSVPIACLHFARFAFASAVFANCAREPLRFRDSNSSLRPRLPGAMPSKTRRRTVEETGRVAKKARTAAKSRAKSLRGVHFATAHGQNCVELVSLLGKVCGKRGGKCLKAIWRQLGQDEKAPTVEGVHLASFSTVNSRPRGSQQLGANLQGLQTIVRELDPEVLHAKAELLAAVARELGGELLLGARHRQVELCNETTVSVVMCEPPRMVLATLVEAFGETNPRRYIENNLIPYFAACGVPVAGMPDAQDSKPIHAHVRCMCSSSRAHLLRFQRICKD